MRGKIMLQKKGYSMRRALLALCSILLFSIVVEAQGVSSSAEPQTDMSEEDDFQFEVSEEKGVVKICGVAFGVNSENVHKAVLLDVACPTENPQLIRKVTEELFGNSSDDIIKVCSDYLSDVQAGNRKVDVNGSMLEIYCICTCFQKGRVFSCLTGQNVWGNDAGKVMVLEQTKDRGWIYDLTRGKNLTKEDVFDVEWLSKQTAELTLEGDIFLNSNLDIVGTHSLKSPFISKKNKKHLHPEFSALIDWRKPALYFTKADFDILQMIKDIDMMNN